MDWAEQHGMNPASIMTQAQANRQAHANLEAFLRQLPDAADEFRRWAEQACRA
jgi:regulator of sirC expression with transglutaminase-like and TPR domain